MFSVVIATPDVVGARMAGPGIRAWNLARELANHFPTTLIAATERGQAFAFRFFPPPVERSAKSAGGRDPHDVDSENEPGAPLDPQSVEISEKRSSDPKVAVREAAVLIGQPARGFRRRSPGQRMIFDLFDPILLELREMYGRHPSLRERIHYGAEAWRLKRAIASGDLFVCATPAQRELYDVAPERLIEIPFGIDLDEIAPAVEREDVIVWGGGVWEWLDPQTAIDAVVRLNHAGVSCRLLFLGRNRPNRRRESRVDALLAGGPPFLMANDEWVPYRERLSWLRRAKIAMMLHRSTPEARYSIRTRLFDAIATATPVIATEEGYAAELVAREGLGIVVPPSDAGAVAAAIRRLLQDDVFHGQCVSNLERIRPRFAWPVVACPLVEAVSRWQTQF